MKKIKILLGVLIVLASLYLFDNINEAKDKFYSDGGFTRRYITNPIDSHVEIPIFIKSYYFITSNNPDLVYIVGDKKIIKFQHIVQSKEDFFKIDSLPNHQVMSNQNYFADDTLNNIYIQNLRSNHIQVLDFNTSSADINVYKSTLKDSNLSPKNIPLVFFNNSLLSYKMSDSKWKYKFSNGLYNSSVIKNKLSEQGHFKYLKNENSYLFVSLFSNKITKFDAKFNEIFSSTTIDTIKSIPKVKEVGNTYQFASAPRITNSDLIVNSKYFLIRSLVKGKNDQSLEKVIMLDIYRVNNLKYWKSISIDNPLDVQPLGIHLLHNNVLLILYENSVFVYKIKI